MGRTLLVPVGGMFSMVVPPASARRSEGFLSLWPGPSFRMLQLRSEDAMYLPRWLAKHLLWGPRFQAALRSSVSRLLVALDALWGMQRTLLEMMRVMSVGCQFSLV